MLTSEEIVRSAASTYSPQTLEAMEQQSHTELINERKQEIEKDLDNRGMKIITSTGIAGTVLGGIVGLVLANGYIALGVFCVMWLWVFVGIILWEDGFTPSMAQRRADREQIPAPEPQTELQTRVEETDGCYSLITELTVESTTTIIERTPFDPYDEHSKALAARIRVRDHDSLGELRQWRATPQLSQPHPQAALPVSHLSSIRDILKEEPLRLENSPTATG